MLKSIGFRRVVALLMLAAAAGCSSENTTQSPQNAAAPAPDVTPPAEAPMPDTPSPASYNAGPGRLRPLRGEAEKRGLNPNVWFGDVERIASEKIGRETVTYVSNIYKYYVACKLAMEQANRREAHIGFRCLVRTA